MTVNLGRSLKTFFSRLFHSSSLNFVWWNKGGFSSKLTPCVEFTCTATLIKCTLSGCFKLHPAWLHFFSIINHNLLLPVLKVCTYNCWCVRCVVCSFFTAYLFVGALNSWCCSCLNPSHHQASHLKSKLNPHKCPTGDNKPQLSLLSLILPH